MDSYLWSDLSNTYVGATFNTGTFSAPVILADQSTTACGELMMTNYGTVIDYMTDSNATHNTGTFSTYNTSDIVSSQYVYSIAFVTGNLGSASKLILHLLLLSPVFLAAFFTTALDRWL